jgi:hypothetical protein
LSAGARAAFAGKDTTVARVNAGRVVREKVIIIEAALA